jgi:beta-N-acetylhexosaminidase
MTPEEKAGQLLMVAIRNADGSALPDALATIHAGSVLYLEYGWTAAATKPISDMLNAQPRPQGIGLWIAVDQEGGMIQRLAGEGFSTIPSATEQGKMDDASLQAKWTAWGAELLAVGVNMNLAPVADTVPADKVDSNAPIGQLGRYFSTDPVLNGHKAEAVIAGLTAAGVGSAIKHFPGLGRVTGNTDYSAEGVTDDVTTANGAYITPFTEAMQAHPTMVMVSVATYSLIDPSNPAAFSPAIINDLLRGQLGWRGVVISDALDAAAVEDVPMAERGVRFIDAGGDIAIIPDVSDAATAHAGIVETMASNPTFAAAVDQAVIRVLTAKLAAGLLSE